MYIPDLGRQMRTSTSLKDMMSDVWKEGALVGVG
jgi:hypothetical protein